MNMSKHLHIILPVSLSEWLADFSSRTGYSKTDIVSRALEAEKERSERTRQAVKSAVRETLRHKCL